METQMFDETQKCFGKHDSHIYRIFITKFMTLHILFLLINLIKWYFLATYFTKQIASYFTQIYRYLWKKVTERKVHHKTLFQLL